MKSTLGILASVLLLFNGLSALFGGWNLIFHPDGSSLGMSVSLLAHSPFRNFLIPGIALFLFIGLTSLSAFIGFILKPRKLAWLIWAEGILLLIWILIQIILIETLHPLQFTLGAVAIAHIMLGRAIAVKNNS